MKGEGTKICKKLFITVVLFTVTLLNAGGIKFCLYTSDKATQMIKQFKPIITHIEKGLGQSIEIKIYPTYEAAIDAVVQGKCSFSRFGPASYIIAKQRNKNIKILAMEHKNLKKEFNGVFVVRKDSNISKLEEFKGKSFAFGSNRSTIGRYLAQEQLFKAGIYAKDLKSYKYLGRHDKVALAVIYKKFDGGVVKDSTFKKYKDRGLKKIATFKNITKPWVASENLDNDTFKKIQNILFEIKDKKLLKTVKKSGFLPSSDLEYEFVRSGMKESLSFIGVTNETHN